MKIFLITDMHLGRDTNYPNLRGEGYTNSFGELVQRVIPALKGEMESCDLVVNLGDFIHDESPEKDTDAYKAGMALFASGAPTKHVLGNHDARHIGREAWARLAGEQKSYYSFDLGGYHHVVLDGNSDWPKGPFYLPEIQMNWLQEELLGTALKTLVYCHFPVDNQNMDNNYYFKDKPERASLANKLFVRNILQKSEKVLAVFSGHTHFYSEQVVGGITHLTVPSFSENDGNHHPKAEYAIVTIEGDVVNVEIKKAPHTTP